MRNLIPRTKTPGAFRAESFDDRTLHAIFGGSVVKVAQLDGAEAIFERMESVTEISSSSMTASSPDVKKWRLFGSKSRAIPLAPLLVVVVAMHRPTPASEVRVVNTAPTPHFDLARPAEYVQPMVRYPVLLKAIEMGRLENVGRPDPRRRQLRSTTEDEPLSEDQQVAFGKLGTPPTEHARRPRLR
jgi:hypothetical protein